MADPVTSDYTAFFLAFAVVWGSLALYLVHLHRVEVRLRRTLERLEREGGRDPPPSTP